MQPCTTIPMLNQTVFSCLILTVASCLACSFFFRSQVRWSGIPISLRILHTLLWSTQSKACSVVNELEVDFFWGGGRFPCFFYDPKDVCNLISGSSAFSKFSLYVWNFSIHVLLKPSLEDFEHYLASIWNEHNCTVVWAFFGLPFFETGVKTDLFQSCGHCWVSHIAGILSAAL